MPEHEHGPQGGGWGGGGKTAGSLVLFRVVPVVFDANEFVFQTINSVTFPSRLITLKFRSVF